MVEVAWMWSFC